MNIIQRLIGANFDSGRIDGIKKIILHTTAGHGSPFNWFNNPQAQASAHYWVGLDGTIEQLVQDADTAWHAGVYAINAQSIGIEFDDAGNPDDAQRTDALYTSGAELIAYLCKSYGVPCELQLGDDFYWAWGINLHRQYATDGRTCPAGLDVQRLQRMAKAILDQEQSPNDDTYRVFKDGTQIGAFKVKENAINCYYENKAYQVTLNGEDITSQIKEEMNTLEEKIAGLESKITGYETDMTRLNSEVEIWKKSAEGLEVKLTESKNANETLQGRIDGIVEADTKKDNYIAELESKLKISTTGQTGSMNVVDYAVMTLGKLIEVIQKFYKQIKK